MTRETPDVVIVGAGAAGLAALRELDRAGKQVVCLEARNRIGGRIYTVHDRLSPIPIELGAEFVHGKSPEILNVVESVPLALYKCGENAVQVRNGKPVKNKDAWLQVGKVMEGLKAAVDAGREETFADFLGRSHYSKDAKELATSYVEGFNAARSDVISIQSLVKDQAAADEIEGDDAFRIMNGYDAVARWLTEGISDLGRKLRLNSEVRAIRWTNGTARVEFVPALNGGVQTVTAQKVMVTVPLGVLHANAIRFDPEPEDVLHAANQLRFGQVFRVILRFQKPIWQEREDFARVGFLLSNEKHFPTWWTPQPIQARSITGWSAGPHSDELIGRSKEEIVAMAVRDLSRILSVSESKLTGLLEAMYFHDWHADVLARGAYSYVPACAMNAREKLAQPVADSLYFAGEATELNGHSATVHGAIASGRRAARQILES